MTLEALTLIIGHCDFGRLPPEAIVELAAMGVEVHVVGQKDIESGKAFMVETESLRRYIASALGAKA